MASKSRLSEQRIRDLLSGQTIGPAATLLRAALSLLSMVYGVIVVVRNLLFDFGLRRIHRARVPLICLGNLTTGGTGKTPVAAFLVRLLQDAGMHPGLISRGYQALDDQANDEKLVLEILCPGVPHRQNRSRILAAELVAGHDRTDVIVMDDGFQHRQLHRDLNILLVDATNPFGFGYLLPRGLLRESLVGIRRADVALITRADLVPAETMDFIRSTIIQHRPELSDRTFPLEFRAIAFRSADGRQIPLETIAGRSVVLVCAIGNPEAFMLACQRLGLRISRQLCFPDHHHYSAEDVNRILQERQNLEMPIVTTLKDLVKLPPSLGALALETEAMLSGNAAHTAFRKLVLEAVLNRSTKGDNHAIS